MTRQIVLVAVVAALAGGVFGFLLRPAPGGGETRPQVPRAAAVDRPIGTGRPGHVALNMEAADRARAASLGYNLFDVGPDEADINSLPAGGRALVWVGEVTGCSDFAMSFSEFAAAVRKLAGNPRVYGWYLQDEPDPGTCPDVVGKLRERADYIHAHAPGQRAFASLTDYPFRPLRPAASHLDLIGVDPYPCRADGRPCRLDDIDKMVRQAELGGFPRSMMVPVFQTFGQTCNDGEKEMRLPSAAELRAVLARWQRLLPHPAFDISYSWGRQDEWACPTLADADGTRGRPDLQSVMKDHNLRAAAGRGRQPASPPTPRPWRSSTPTNDGTPDLGSGCYRRETY